jgi:hypothetical protein
MKKQVLLRASILMSALLVLNGCKGSDTAKDAKSDDVTTVLDAGAEPLEELRYKIAHGTRMTSTLDFASARLATTERVAVLETTPGVRLHIVSGPTMKGKRGRTRYDVRVVKSEAIIPERMPRSQAIALNKAVQVMNNVGGWVEIDDRGLIQRSELNSRAKNPDLPARLLLMLINARTSLARVVLPAEPVGIGARWEARKELLLYGFKVTQSDTYTMTEKAGDEVTLNVQIQQTAPKQTVTFEEDGVELTLEALSMNATGRVVVNLNALEANAAASGEAANLMNVKTVEGTEKLQIDSAFDVRMAVTYEVAETIEKGKKQLEEAKATRKEAEQATEQLEEAQE